MVRSVGLTRGVFLDVASVNAGDLDFAQLKAALPSLQYYPLTDVAEISEHLQDTEVVITNKVPLNGDCLRKHNSLKLICVAATGTNNIDLQVAAEQGIAVCNVRAYATASVVQHVFALILALQTRLLEIRQALGEGRWSRSAHFCLLDYPVTELAGKTLGIVGYGELGQAVARLAEALGMRVLVARRDNHDQRSGRVDLHAMLPLVDVLSLHCPLTEQTTNLITGTELALMKKTALLINTARGGIVDEQALLAALRSGQIAGAGFDVLTTEPPPADHPMLQYAENNLIVTPHVAWASREARQRLLDEIAQNILAFQQGESRNRLV